jgi:hypothetical protein
LAEGIGRKSIHVKWIDLNKDQHSRAKI